MTGNTAIQIDRAKQTAAETFVLVPPIPSSFQSDWKNIALNRFQFPAGETPEIIISQHAISIYPGRPSPEVELVIEGRTHLVPSCNNTDNMIGIVPAGQPVICRCTDTMDFTHLYLDANFLNHVAYESVNPEGVEVMVTLPPTLDPLTWQICIALIKTLEIAPTNSCFYAESIATALAAHLLQNYATSKQIFRQYTDGLSKHILKRSIEYINEHLHESLSLATIAAELGMSQYYFCRLFKQSMGISPHAYLTQQRVEKSKQLLKHKEIKLFDIAADCGFANPSHFAKCFRKQTGISPHQFRMI